MNESAVKAGALQLAHGAGVTVWEDCLRAINEKLIRRHPHIFSDGDAKTAEAWTAAMDGRLGLDAGSEQVLAADVVILSFGFRASPAPWWGEHGIALEALREGAAQLRSTAASVMYLAVEGQLAGLVGVADPIKASTAEAIAAEARRLAQ